MNRRPRPRSLCARHLGPAFFLAALGWVGCARSTSVGSVGGPADAAVAGDAHPVDAAVAGDARPADASSPGTPEELCLETGGAVTTQSCCSGAIPFPDSCAIGACGCAPASSVPVSVCSCSAGCYATGLGCVGPTGICTAGVDASCDQDPGAATPRGRCVSGNRCACVAGATLTSAGKCL